MASVQGPAAALAEFAATVELPPEVEQLGPVPLDADGERERLLLRVPRRDSRALAAALHAAQASRSARKVADPLRVQLDPLELV
jgi:primosomal protein N' (replication factor Y)